MVKKNSKPSTSKRKSHKHQSMKKRKEITSKNLMRFGENLYNQIVKSEFPWIEMPSRSTSNILYDERLKQYWKLQDEITDQKKEMTILDEQRKKLENDIIWAVQQQVKDTKELSRLNMQNFMASMGYANALFQQQKQALEKLGEEASRKST